MSRENLNPKKKPIDQDELDRLARLAARAKRLEAAKRRELLFHLIYVSAILITALLRVSIKESYDMQQAVRAVIEDDFPSELGTNQKSFYDVANAEEMYQFLQHPFMEAMSDPPWVIGNNNRIIGGFRILQHRVEPNKCCTVLAQWLEPYKKKLGPRAPYECLGNYEPFCAAKNPYGVTVVFNNITTKKYAHWETDDLFAGTDGRFANYDGSGYPLDFEQIWDPDTSKALKGIKELEAQGFVDRQTRAVIVQMPIYSMNFNIFLWVKLIFEFTPGGLVYPKSQYIPLQPVLYGQDQDQERMVFEIIVGTFLLVYTLRFARELCLTKRETGSCMNAFSSFWVPFDLLFLLATWGNAVLLLWYGMNIQHLDVRVDYKYFIDLDGPAHQYELANHLFAISCWLTVIKTFKYMAISQKLGLVNRSLSRGASAVATFFVIYMMIYMAFVLMGYQIFGPYVEGYSSMFKAVVSLFLASSGVVDYHDLVEGSPIFAPLFFFMFVIVIVFVMLNMFIGIICEAFAAESEETTVSLAEEISMVVQHVKQKYADMRSNKKEEDDLARIAADMGY